MLWFMQKPNEKLLSFVIILLWEVIYAHFYNWDRLFDFISVVYELIELIIEASLWFKDYSTLDTHPQHTSLWFNECLSHLCDCTCSNVMCMLKYLMIKPKKNIYIYIYIFLCFIRFWKWFYTFVLLVFVQNALLCFSLKTMFKGHFARSSQLRASREKCLREINLFDNSHKNFCDCLATNSFSRNAVCPKLDFSKFRQKLSRLYRYCLATYSFSRKFLCFRGLSR